jgi:hypothetical protein
MKVLIGFESSGRSRRAFAARGHDVWSIDLLPAEDGSNRHIVGDILDHLDDGWDLLALFHPPCTRLCNSGVRWLSDPPTKLSPFMYPPDVVAAYSGWSRKRRLAFMWSELDKGAELFSRCWNADIPRIAAENPIMHRHARERIVNYQPPAQYVQPWWFGDPAFKATGLYLKNLPPLVPSNKLTPPQKGTPEHAAWSLVHRASPGPDRWRDRSRTWPGMADAFADQWGSLDPERIAT